MKRISILAMSLAAAALVAGSALAQPPTEAEKRACRRDVQRNCRHLLGQPDQVVGQCLVQHAATISRSCQQVLRNHGAIQ